MSKLLSFIGGLGSGYMSQTDKNKDRARQERLDEQNQQLFDARMAQTRMQTAAMTREEKLAQAKADALEGMSQYAEGNEATGEIRQSFQDATGLSKDSTALLASKAGGYGGGTTGLQAAAAGDVALESRRLRPAAPVASQAPAVESSPADVPAVNPAPMAAATQAATPAPATAAAKPVFSSSVGGLAAAAGAYTEKGLLERQKKYFLLSGDMTAAGAAQEKIKSLDERDADVSAYGRIGKMTNAQLFAEYGKHFNENRNLDGDVSLDAATGKLYIKPYDPATPAREVPRSALEQAAFTVHRIGRGDVAAGMAKMGALDQEQRQLVGGYSAQRMAIAKAIAKQSRFDKTYELSRISSDRQVQMTDMQIKAGTLAYEKALEETKMPPGVRQQIDVFRDELKLIAAAQTKAQAENLGGADTPGGKALMARQAVVNDQLREVLAQLTPKKNADGAQPFGAPGNDTPSDKPPKMAPISYKAPLWEDAELAAHKATGVPLKVIQTIRLQGERSNGDQISPKGARGVYQFTPSSRDAFLKKYNVDAYSIDPAQQSLAAALHLKESFDRTNNWNQAMAGFNGGISGENGTNPTAENKNYAERTRISGMPTSPPR